MTDGVQNLYRKALELHQQGNLASAEELYQQVLAANPKHDESLHLLGLIRVAQKRFEEGIALIKQALAIDPNFAAAHMNLGTTYVDMERPAEAEASYRNAIRLKPQNPEAHFALGTLLMTQHRDTEALSSFNEAIKLQPNYAEAHFNKGALLNKLGQHEMALTNLGKAIDFKPHYPEAYFVRGESLYELEHWEKALKSYRMAAEQGCKLPALLTSTAKALESLGLKKEALELYKSIDAGDEQKPNAELMGAKAKLCLWDGFDQDVEKLTRYSADNPVTGAELLYLQMVDDPALQRNLIVRNAQKLPKWAQKKFPKLQWPERPIRIGYFSPDFKQHPVSQLLAGVLEHHDRSKFRVELFALGRAQTDRLQHRMIKAADSYQSIRAYSVEEVERTLDDKLDIAVDLAGYTAGARTGIFSRGVAPIQVNYLGFPGTLGLEAVQYIIADPVVVPPGSEDGFVEKIVRLPNSFFPNDRSRPESGRPLSRAEVGLAENVFVFCALNNLRKLTPTMFDVWVAILKEIPDSVLWLPGDSPEAEENLRREAQARGLSPQRLIFATRAAAGDYYERFKCADLFLDSFPYNAHTVAADALWGGIPLLTYAGKSFVSRVAASLLTTMGLPELITHSFDEYKAAAIGLAQDRPRLDALTKRVRANRDTSPLYDVVSYTKHLEAAYIQMVERFNQGLPADHISIT